MFRERDYLNGTPLQKALSDSSGLSDMSGSPEVRWALDVTVK